MNLMLNRVFVAVVAVFATAIGSRAATSGGDEVDQKIEDAMVNVRGDRPWRAPGAPSVDRPIQLRSYSPGMASECSTGFCQKARWQYSLTPYFWAPGMRGTLQAGQNKIDIDQSIGDVLSSVFQNFQMAGMLRFEADYCKWSIMGDLIYVSIGNTESLQTAAGAPVSARWSYDMLIAEAYGGYRFAQVPLGCGDACFRPNVTFDALAGLRGYHFGLAIDFDPGPEADRSLNWIDPVVGARALFHVTPALTFNAMANIGGFGIGSDLSWQIVAGVAYKVSNCVSIDAGWSVLSIDYQHKDTTYDLTLSGPYLGATFRF